MTDKCSICLQIISVFQKKTLKCKHTFHKACLRKLVDKRCPICNKHIFTALEIKLLTTANQYEILRIAEEFKKNRSYDITPVLRQAIKQSNTFVVKILLDLFDAGSLLLEFINNEFQPGVKLLMENPKNINWYASYNGETLIEKVLNSKNIEIKNIISNKNPSFAQMMNHHNIYPHLTLYLPDQAQ
jgi:hypothetical protein